MVVEHYEPVVAIPLIENGREEVYYAVETESEAVTAAATLPSSVQDALSLAGVWSDLDWDEIIEALDTAH